MISPGPDSRAELIETLAEAEQRELIEPESRMMLEGVIRMADMTAGDVMVAAPRMDLLDIDAPYDELLRAGDRHRALALSGLRRAAAKHHRHPDREGPAEAAAGAGAEPAHAAAAGGVRAGEQAAERAAARLPQQPQPPGHRHRRVRQHGRPDHDRGRARGDRRRDRGRVRRARRRVRHLHAGRRHAPGGRRHRASRGERGVRHRICRRTTSTPSAAWSRTSWAACRGAAKRSTWAGCASR